MTLRRPSPADKSALRNRIAGCVCAALLLVLTTACQSKQPAPPVEVEVEEATATVGPITEHIHTDAILSPVAQAAIVAKITAPVRRFYVQRGSKVKVGQLLATMENRDLTAAVEDNRGAFESATATYRSTVKAQVPEEYQRAELDVEQTRANLNLNRQIVMSRKQLFAQGAIAGRDLDTAQAALVQVQAAFDAAQKHLASLHTVSRAAALENASGQLQSAKGKYAAAEAALSYSEIHSPIAGVVTDRPLFAGETALPGSPLITVMDTSSLLAKVHLPQPDAQLLRKGAAATILVPSLSHSVQGTVALISPALDPGSTTVEIWVLLPNPAGELRPGTPVHVILSAKSTARALLVPSSSIMTSPEGGKTVMVIDSGGFVHQTAVRTGMEDGREIQILSGLAPGERVAARGAYALDDRTRVKVVPSLDHDGPENGSSVGAGAGEQ